MQEMRIGLVGPLPPPAGGMAGQTRQLAELLRREGATVEVIQSNAPHRPRWVGKVRRLREITRLLPYLARLWKAAGRVRLFHVMANSGWAWHLVAAPAICIARMRGIAVVVHYHGGRAGDFLAQSLAWVRPVLSRADVIVTPSLFLQGIFNEHGFAARVIPNIVDLGQFRPGAEERPDREAPHIVVTRNLEAVYDIQTAVHAFALVRQRFPAARLTVAGSGPERERLESLARTLGLEHAVRFAGSLETGQMAELYRAADMMLNPSLVDNAPVSILEALASGVPVVSTNVGGVPYLVEHGKTAVLVSAGDPQAMAQAAVALLNDREQARRLVAAGLEAVQRYSWAGVRDQWREIYSALARPAHGEAARTA